MRREFFFCAQRIFLLCAQNFADIRIQFFRYAQPVAFDYQQVWRAYTT
jgi:hypothetical protein